MEEITVEERQLLVQFRERVHDELPSREKAFSDSDQYLYLVKWLRARNGNLEKALQMFRNSMRWRDTLQADKILDMEVDPFWKTNFPLVLTGPDRFGQPFLLLPLSTCDMRILKTRSHEEFERNIAYLNERIKARMWSMHFQREEGQPAITFGTLILDAKDYAYSQLLNYTAVKRIIQLAKIYEDNYPDTIQKVFFINCSSYIALLFKVLKPVLARRTLDRFVCYSSMAEWQEVIGEYFDPSIVPERYGGTAKCEEVRME